MSKENEETIEVYEKFGDKYLARDKNELNVNEQALKDDARQKKVIAGYVAGLPDDAEIFEVGSAAGRDAKYLRSLGYKNITVSDVAGFFLDELKKEGFEPVKFNLITDEFDKKYGFIFCWAVLVHFTKDEAKAAIYKMYDALKDGGRLAFCVKHKEGAVEEWGDYKNMIGAKRYFSYWTEDELKQILEELNFKKFDIVRHGGTRACWLECYGEK